MQQASNSSSVGTAQSTALRLLTLSARSYDSALKANPLDENASRGQAIAQANTWEV